MTTPVRNAIGSGATRRAVARYTSSGRQTPLGPDPRIALPMGPMDPFLLLDHHGPTTYSPGAVSPQIGAHPHRGFETVTFIVQGALRHEDSTGFESIVHAGGFQWMTAGSGLYHDECLPADFLAKGGTSEVIQLWLNLPPRLKMVAPRYQPVDAAELVHVALGADGADMAIVAGERDGQSGPVHSFTDAFVSTITAVAGSRLSLPVPNGRRALLHVVTGSIETEGAQTGARTMLDYSSEGETIDLTIVDDALLLFCHANPIDAPIAAEGPFVMNTREEIERTLDDFRSGRVSKGALA